MLFFFILFADKASSHLDICVIEIYSFLMTSFLMLSTLRINMIKYKTHKYLRNNDRRGREVLYMTHIFRENNTIHIPNTFALKNNLTHTSLTHLFFLWGEGGGDRFLNQYFPPMPFLNMV